MALTKRGVDKVNKVNRLARLPLELRFMVYRELLVKDGINYGRFGSTAIMRTCRAFHTEASQILYRENCLGFDISDQHRLPKPLRAPLATLVRDLYIRVFFDRTFVLNSEIFRFLAQPDLQIKRLTMTIYLQVERSLWYLCNSAFEYGQDEHAWPLCRTLSQIKQVQQFDIFLYEPIFASGEAQELKRLFLNGEGPPEKMIRFMMSTECFAVEKQGGQVNSSSSSQLSTEHDFLEVTDLTESETGTHCVM